MLAAGGRGGGGGKGRSLAAGGIGGRTWSGSGGAGGGYLRGEAEARQGVGGRGKQFTLCRRGLPVRGGRGREREGDPWLTMFLALDLYPKSFTGRPCAAHSPENLCVYL